MANKFLKADQKRIYFARKAVHVYKHFKKKHARATDLLNKNMGCDDTYPPMVRVSSAKMWRMWKKLVVALEKWIQKDGFSKEIAPELLNTCIVVLKMMIFDQEKRKDLEILGLDNA